MRRFDAYDYAGVWVNTTTWKPTTTDTRHCHGLDRMHAWDGETNQQWYTPDQILPPSGFYTSATCAQFPVPMTHRMVHCDLVPISVCADADSPLCSHGRACVDVEGGHLCDCAQGHVNVDALTCTPDAVSLEVYFADTYEFVHLELLQQFSGHLWNALGIAGFIAPEAPVQFAKDRLSRDDMDMTTSERIWIITLDIPYAWLRSNFATVTPILNDTCSAHNFTFLFSRHRDISQGVVSVNSNGVSVLESEWVDDPVSGLGWKIRLQVSMEPTSRKVLYLSQQDGVGGLRGASYTQNPCQYTGLQLDANACCVGEFARLFTVPDALVPYVTCLENASSLPRLSANGSFHTLYNSTSHSTYTMSPAGDSAEIEVFLSYHDAETKFAVKTVQQAFINFEWFLGVADVAIFDSQPALSYTHMYFKSVISSVFTSMLSSSVTEVLNMHVDIKMMTVKTDEDTHRDFASVTVTLLNDHMVFEQLSALPENAATYKIAYTHGSGSNQYMCPFYDQNAFSAFQSQHKCSFQQAVCGVSAYNEQRTLSFVFPLGDNVFQGVLAEYDTGPYALLQRLYLDFMVTAKNSQTGRTVTERVQTSSEIQRHQITVQCASVETQVQLKDLVTVDLIGGIMQTYSDLNSTVSYFPRMMRQTSNDICDEVNPDSICMTTPKVGLGSITIVVMGQDRAFASPSSITYDVQVSAMFSIYFLSEIKRIAVRNLIRQNLAFETPDNVALENSPFLIPTQALLDICPMTIIKGSYGCISRYEIEDGVLDWQTGSIAPLGAHRATNETTDESGVMDVVLRNWVRSGAFGDSAYVRDAIESHSGIVIDTFNVNNRYRRALLQSNVLPWTASAMQELNISSRIDVVQDTFTFMLVTMKSSQQEYKEEVYASVVIPASIPLSCPFFFAHSYLTNAYMDTYIAIFGLSRALTSVHQAEQDVGASNTTCSFTIRLDLPYQRQTRALAQAKKIARLVSQPTSMLSQRITLSLRDIFQGIVQKTGIDMPGLDFVDFRGTGDAYDIPYHSTQARRRHAHQGSRVLAAADDDYEDIFANSTRNESVFASEISSRRYRDVSSSDKMARLVEEQLMDEGRQDEIANGTSRLALLQVYVPPDLACLQNETLAMDKMSQILEDALKQSTTSEIASIRPTSFVILETVDCSPANRRRLLQARSAYTASTEMVVVPKIQESAAVVIEPTKILYNLGSGVQLISIQQAKTLNPLAVQVKSSWIGAMPPDSYGSAVYMSKRPIVQVPQDLLDALEYCYVGCLVLGVFSVGMTALHLSYDAEKIPMNSVKWYDPMPPQYTPRDVPYPYPPTSTYYGSYPHTPIAQPPVYVPTTPEGHNPYAQPSAYASTTPGPQDAYFPQTPTWQHPWEQISMPR